MREPDRLYPQSTLAAHVLGYIDAEGHGVSGMEKVLEAPLTADATRDKPVALSIDVRVQAALENELAISMADLQAAGAAGIVLDVRTGEVIAMVSLPSFNPNALAGAAPPNNVTQSVYELGSTFKPLAVAAAIDTGLITNMARRFDATKPLQVGRFSISDDPGDEQFRWLNIPETLVYSSNIATARIADELGAARMQDLFRRLGFDRRPAIEVGGAKPLWPNYWGRVTVMTTLFVDEHYIPTLDMKMVKGRNFSKDFPTDSVGIILNESAAALLGMKPTTLASRLKALGLPRK
jgi:cell division protein FtsI (penicillin-binding protein 3)